MTMLNRLRAAIACLRGRPVIAHCQLEGPLTLNSPRATVIENTFYEDDEPVGRIRDSGVAGEAGVPSDVSGVIIEGNIIRPLTARGLLP